MSLILLLSTVLIAPALSALAPPKYFYVFGDRKSGASYLSELIVANTNPHEIQDCYLLSSHTTSNAMNHHQAHSSARRPDTHDLPGLDHDRPTTFPRHSLVTKRSMAEMQCPVAETLFIFITKDPYSWMASMAGREASNGVPRRSVLRQITSGSWNKDGDKYKTIMAARTDKMKAGFKAKHLPNVQHYEAVKYEDFLDGAVQSLNDLLRKHKVPRNKNFVGVFHDTASTGATEKPDTATATTAGTKSRKFMDHVGAPFKKFKYYADAEYLKYYDTDMMDSITKSLDNDLEMQAGYYTPPKQFHEKHAEIMSQQRSSAGTLWHFISTVTWWVVLALSILLIVVAPFAIWLASTPEAADTVAQGDGVEPEVSNNNVPNASNARAALAPGWFEAVDVDSGKPYYFHRATREVSWIRPVVAGSNNSSGGGGGGAYAERKKDDDYDHNSGEFQDALYSVAREQAMRRTNGGADTDAVTHEIATKLRKRFVKRAMEQQEQSESVRREVEHRRNAQRHEQMLAQQQYDQQMQQLSMARVEQAQVDEYAAYVERQRQQGHETRIGGVSDAEYEAQQQAQREREEYVRNMELEMY
jgi:hypothetical protein